MAESTQVYNGSMLINNVDISQIFFCDCVYDTRSFKNVEATEQTIKAGTVLGMATSGTHAGKVIVMKSAATDGSKTPIGILTETIKVAAGASKSVSVCVKGKVDQNLLTFNGTDTLATVVDGKNYRDRLMSDTLGIYGLASYEETHYDNQ